MADVCWVWGGACLMIHCFLVDELTEKQEKHSTRPDVFDDVEEEHAIDILTAEITQVMTS